MSRSDEVYKPALEGKKVPVLTLDHKWHRLFTQIDTNPEIKSLETELNELLKRQGKINTETKEIKALKNKLMEEIRSSSMDAEALDEKKVEENKKLVEDCNEKLEAYQDEALDLPAKINEINKKLMLATMEVCYDDIKEGTEEINEISQWIDEVRVELKKKVVRKQEKQKRIQDLYAFMHDIFGADVIEIFDMKYNPDENMNKLQYLVPSSLGKKLLEKKTLSKIEDNKDKTDDAYWCLKYLLNIKHAEDKRYKEINQKMIFDILKYVYITKNPKLSHYYAIHKK